MKTELWYRDKIKGTMSRRNWNLMKQVTRSILQSSYRGEFFDELEVEGFLRERFTECKFTELIIKKTRSSLTIPVRCIKREVFEDMQNNGRNLKTFFISGSSGLGKSDLQRFGKEEQHH